MKKLSNIVLIGFCAVFAISCSSNAANSENAAVEQKKAASAPVVEKLVIPSGSRLHVTLIDGVGSAKSSRGDEFSASLSDPVVVNGKTVVPRGTRVRGRVADVNESGRVKGRASLSLVLTTMTFSGKTVALDTRPFVAVAESTKKRDAAVIGGGAGVGAVVGAIAGGKKGAGVGALIGGGAGTGTVLATKGKDLNYPPESRISFTLTNSVEL